MVRCLPAQVFLPGSFSRAGKVPSVSPGASPFSQATKPAGKWSPGSSSLLFFLFFFFLRKLRDLRLENRARKSCATQMGELGLHTTPNRSPLVESLWVSGGKGCLFHSKVLPPPMHELVVKLHLIMNGTRVCSELSGITAGMVEKG